MNKPYNTRLTNPYYVKCPQCGAAPNVRCISGLGTVMKEPHARRNAAFKRALLLHDYSKAEHDWRHR